MTKIVSERTVKRRIKEVLDKYRKYHIYVFMPVPGGYGVSTLDYLGFLCGFGFAIEAIEASGCPVFVVRDDQGLLLLDQWLETIAKDMGP